jgi:hypothetical protein
MATSSNQEDAISRAIALRSKISQLCDPSLLRNSAKLADRDLSQEPEQEPKQEPEQEPEQESKQEPEQEPKQEPKQEPEQESKQEPEQEPKQEPEQEPEQKLEQESKQEPKKKQEPEKITNDLTVEQLKQRIYNHRMQLETETRFLEKHLAQLEKEQREQKLKKFITDVVEIMLKEKDFTWQNHNIVRNTELKITWDKDLKKSAILNAVMTEYLKRKEELDRQKLESEERSQKKGKEKCQSRENAELKMKKSVGSDNGKLNDDKVFAELYDTFDKDPQTTVVTITVGECTHQLSSQNAARLMIAMKSTMGAQKIWSDWGF